MAKTPTERLSELAFTFAKDDSIEANLLSAIMFFISSICLTGRTDLLRKLADVAKGFSAEAQGSMAIDRDDEWPTKIGERS